jgi:hypothetical protein
MTSSTTSSQVWTYWTTDGGTGTATTNQLWGSCTTDTAWVNWTQLRQQREQEDREWEERLAITNAEKEAADEKAIELLQDLISDEEFEVYQKTGRLLVRGRKHDYLVQRDSGRVVRCEKGKVADLCMHLENYHSYSKHDNVIAMKLFLEGREDEFNREANLCGRRDPEPVEQELLKVVNG